MNHAEQQATKLAAELYDDALSAGKRFTVAELQEALKAELVRRFDGGGPSILGDLVEIVSTTAINRVDKERTKPAEQGSLFDDLDRSIPVGATQRRARRRMDNQDWTAHLAHVAENVARVTQSAARENARYAALAPYLAQGMDTETALAAWQADHPKAVLP